MPVKHAQLINGQLADGEIRSRKEKKKTNFCFVWLAFNWKSEYGSFKPNNHFSKGKVLRQCLESSKHTFI